MGINRFSTAFFFLGFTIVSSAHSQDVNPATPTDIDCPTTVKASLKATSLEVSEITIKEACTQHNGQAASALAEIKNARTQSAKKTKTKLAARLRPCRAETWKLSRARALNPTADKALINSKILEACVQADFSPQAALKSVSGAYFALNQRSGKRPLEQKAKASDQDTSANNPIGNACPQDVGRFMNRRELVHTLDHETMAARISTVCKTAKGDAERAFEILLKSLNSP